MARKGRRQRRPVSAVAARKARQQSQIVPPALLAENPDIDGGIPRKRLRLSFESEATQAYHEPHGSLIERQKETGEQCETDNGSENPSLPRVEDIIVEDLPGRGSEECVSAIPDNGANDEFGFGDRSHHGRSPLEPEVVVDDFRRLKIDLDRSTVIYSDDTTLCVRIRKGKSIAPVGEYEFWVKRGVISLMGAKLPSSPQLYRAYAPSTHSLPVIKCISGAQGSAEVELRSCSSGISHLSSLSPLYQGIWTSRKMTTDQRRSFSVVFSSSNNRLKRDLRPLHLNEKWSLAIKTLARRGAALRVLICGPKGTGKSTFSRCLVNHLLSPAPQVGKGHGNPDGVAFLDLDPGQPEFSPTGEIYLAHLNTPYFGPPFSHPSLEGSRDGKVIRAHHIGSTSPKENSDHYAIAAMDLLDHYRTLLATYPRCPLVINSPGWIFGLGLEMTMWLIKSLGLSDIAYMSEKGPDEVVMPLIQAASEVMVSMVTLPSQPIEFTTRSSAQLRSMQMQSYFHMSYPLGVQNPYWSGCPLTWCKPIFVDYAGPRPGVLGIMVQGSRLDPDVLHDILEGATIAVVAVEDLSAFTGHGLPQAESEAASEAESTLGIEMEGYNTSDAAAVDIDHLNGLESQSPQTSLESLITRTPREGLPYLFVGVGSCVPPDPRVSHSLGLAFVREINTSACKLELVTPIPTSRIYEALKYGKGIVLVRGQLDNPNWAISEEYHAARTAEYKHYTSIFPRGEVTGGDSMRQFKISRELRNRVLRASNLPWITVTEEINHCQAKRKRMLWKLNKKAYTGNESEVD